MSRHRSTPRTFVKVVAQVAVVLALAAGTVWLVTRDADRPTDAAAPQAVPTSQEQQKQQEEQAQTPLFNPHPILMVISDSIGNGIGDVNMRNYPQVLADQFGFQVTVDAVGARGFLPTDLSPIGVDKVVPPFSASLKRMADTYRADYIIVDGGRNDLGKNPEEVAPAIDDYLVQLRKYYPAAKIAILTPGYINADSADGNQQFLDGAIRASAEKVGAYVFDPIGEGWFRDVDLETIRWTDGIHLNQKGAEYYAQKIADDMRRQGVVSESPQGAS